MLSPKYEMEYLRSPYGSRRRILAHDSFVPGIRTVAINKCAFTLRAFLGLINELSADEPSSSIGYSLKGAIKCVIKSFLKRTSRRFNLNKEDGFHICYAMGVARGDQYASLQSLGSSIKQGLDFIHENRERFDNHTFYAHNGGSYDAMFLFKEGLLEDDRFDIPELLVDHDVKYIHFKVVVGGDTVITFRDSLRLLPQGLEKLCKEFDVEHKKADRNCL